ALESLCCAPVQIRSNNKPTRKDASFNQTTGQGCQGWLHGYHGRKRTQKRKRRKTTMGAKLMKSINCKPRENSKRTFVRGRVTTYMSALGLSALALSNQSAQAQNCNELCAPAISCGVSIQNLATGLGSGTFARVGDTIRINSVNVGIVQGSCFVADGAFGNTGGWVAKPNGAGGQIVQKSHGTYQLTAIGQVHICNGTVGNPCLAFNTDYVVSDADVNRPLSIGSPTELPAT